MTGLPKPQKPAGYPIRQANQIVVAHCGPEAHRPFWRFMEEKTMDAISPCGTMTIRAEDLAEFLRSWDR